MALLYRYLQWQVFYNLTSKYHTVQPNLRGRDEEQHVMQVMVNESTRQSRLEMSEIAHISRDGCFVYPIYPAAILGVAKEYLPLTYGVSDTKKSRKYEISKPMISEQCYIDPDAWYQRCPNAIYPWNKSYQEYIHTLEISQETQC